VREAYGASDGHSRAEQDVYHACWEIGIPQTDSSRLLTMGMAALARHAGLSESNARLNLRSLVRKLALEEYSTYVCEQGLGRTWRIFSPDQVFERRAHAGLRFFMKRTLAVVFVDPLTKQPLLI